MKILDRYILVSYLKTFLSVFTILMFIFVLQSIWLYISELAGRGLDFFIILKFLWFVLPRLIPLVLPLTILVASLMVFGSFSENYEFAAMKSTGISLQRAMKSLTFFILLLSILVFFFANSIIPLAEYKWLNLRRNIQQFKPSMVISEGQFNQIGDEFNIKVDKKSGENDQFLTGIVIHKKDAKHISENNTVIIADNGELTSKEGSNTLSLALNDGNYYSDIISKDPKKKKNKEFVKSYFEQYIINIDLTELNNKDINKENKLNNHNMYNVSELRAEIDSQSVRFNNNIKAFTKNMYFRTGISKFNRPDKKKSNIRIIKDSIPFQKTDTLLNLFNAKHQSEIVKMALNNIKSSLQSVEAKKKEYFIKAKRLNKYEIALHEKFALAVACIVLFFVGAPLGAIIRKGGLGLPMVVAILLFLTYHFIGIFAKNSAEDGSISPFVAAWLSTVIMFPLGIWLTYRATTDQGIIDIGAFSERITKLFKKKNKDESKDA
ncbi:MAG: LptF/LptG family permease [Flavobacteriaceae bacterium]|nr:LptF/LptG family permease [Flavobacteriaceae bacterium]